MKQRSVEIRNTGKGNVISRPSHVCYALTIDLAEDRHFLDSLHQEARALAERVSAEQANTAQIRSPDILYLDCLSGCLAEQASVIWLNTALKEGVASRPPADSARNQIDLLLGASSKTIEVRSSFVRNGLEFALFQKERDSGRQYIDILGPYQNPSYKASERYKDYYLRVLFPGVKQKCASLLATEGYTFYITGGATKEMMQSDDFSYIKDLSPREGEVLAAGNYRVIPLGQSLDSDQFLAAVKTENRLWENGL